MANRSISIDASEVIQGLERFDNTMQAQLKVVGSTISHNMEAYAKSNHPWTNRTYSAEHQLKGDFTVNDNTLDIMIKHGVDYGIWLELAHEKNYAIIAPTVREEGPRIVSDLDNLMSKLKL